MNIYLTTHSESEKHLTEAECVAITGAVPDDRGIALAEVEADVSKAAYIKTCMKVIYHAASLPELYSRLEEAGLSSHEFRISVVKFPRRLPVDSRQVMYEVGARIDGRPNLSSPKVVFLVVVTSEEVWLGEVLSESDGSWSEHSQKARLYSSSLPTRLARAMVNLAAVPGDSIIDPCCGSGTILIEAASMGVKALGCDINPKLAATSIENLKYFNLSSLVMIADARHIAGSFDAVVTDLPYGRNSLLDEKLCRKILENLRNMAPKAVVVAGEDMSTSLMQMGYNVKRIIAVPKTSLTRHIHILQTRS